MSLSISEISRILNCKSIVFVFKACDCVRCAQVLPEWFAAFDLASEQADQRGRNVQKVYPGKDRFRLSRAISSRYFSVNDEKELSSNSSDPLEITELLFMPLQFAQRLLQYMYAQLEHPAATASHSSALARLVDDLYECAVGSFGALERLGQYASSCERRRRPTRSPTCPRWQQPLRRPTLADADDYADGHFTSMTLTSAGIELVPVKVRTSLSRIHK